MKSKLVFTQYPSQNANELARLITSSFQNADLHNRLSKDNEIEFALQPLLYSFNLDIALTSINTFSRWLINPNFPNAILDIVRFNKYIQKVFEAIPIIYAKRPMHRDDVFESTFRFLRDTITPELAANERHPFNRSTWNISLTCLIESVLSITRNNSQVQTKETEIISNLMDLFVEGFLIAELDIDDADLLIYKFLNLCFFTKGTEKVGSSGKTKSNSVHWNSLFYSFFTAFINFPEDPKRRSFILNVIARMKFRSKIAEDELSKAGNARATILADFFDISLKTFKEHFSANSKTSLFQNKIPSEALLRMLGDGVFITNLYSYNILDHFRNIFTLFTNGVLPPNSPWISALICYLNAFLLGSAGRFVNIFALMNTAHNFAAENPRQFNEFIKTLLISALQVPIAAPVNLPPEFTPLLNVGPWTQLLANSLEFARTEGNEEIECGIISVIDNFTMILSSNASSNDDFAIYKLMLLANAGSGSMFSTAYVSMLSSKSSVSHEMLMLALSPHYMSDIAPAIQNCALVESLIKTVEQKQTQFPYQFNSIPFMIALIEINKRTDYFLKYRLSHSSLTDFLKTQITSKIPLISTMAEIVENLILAPSVSVQQMNKFCQNYPKVLSSYVFNGRILSFRENTENKALGLIIRGPFGITVFDITEVSPELAQTIDEKMLKDDTLHRSEITFDDVNIFAKYVETPETEEKSLSKSFLMALGIASMSITAPNLQINPLNQTQDGFEQALKDFDDSCGLSRFEILVAHIAKNSNSFFSETEATPRYNKFLQDLGKSYNMGYCQFCFNDKFPTGDILVIFNESDKQLNTEFLEVSQFEIIIVVTPLYQSLTKDEQMYKVSIIKCHPKYKEEKFVPSGTAFQNSQSAKTIPTIISYPILPYPDKEIIISSKDHLARTLSSICFFYYGQGQISSNSEVYRCILAEKYTELYKTRKEKLDNLVKKYTLQQDIIKTLVNDD